MDTLRLTPADLTQAADLLRAGELVAFPTETVYGLGANALDPAAVEKIFQAKQRPHWDPLIVHIADAAQLAQIAQTTASAEVLMRAFWPGPLTLLLPKTDAIPEIVTANRPMVGVRIPSHPLALALLREAAIPIAAPSANTFGHTSPTTAAHVLADLDGRIAAVLDGGPTSVGLESTVAEIRRFEVILYREGAVTAAMIESTLGPEWHVHTHIPEPLAAPPESLPSPGVGTRHYAPRARLILVPEFREKEIVRSHRLLELSLVDAIDTHSDSDTRIGVMLPDHWNESCADVIFRWGPWHEPEILSQRLYTGLRYLDDEGCTLIICPLPESSQGLSAAIRDRLQKAARLA